MLVSARESYGKSYVFTLPQIPGHPILCCYVNSQNWPVLLDATLIRVLLVPALMR